MEWGEMNIKLVGWSDRFVNAELRGTQKQWKLMMERWRPAASNLSSHLQTLAWRENEQQEDKNRAETGETEGKNKEHPESHSLFLEKICKIE